ncbi:MAG TPA: hypothetical protein VGG03_28150 [Thermoanaerobaculia bacterium]|jgi:hypothetical protein
MNHARRFLVLAALLGALTVAVAGGSGPAWAAQYCSVNCAVSTLECNTSGTCSSSPGTLTCCGQTYTCTAIDAYDNCRAECSDEFWACRLPCPNKSPCYEECYAAYRACNQSCGSRPATSFSC